MLFDVEQQPTRNESLIMKFNEYCNRASIIQCYKNKLELNVNYNIEVENQIKKIESNFIDSFNLPWWLELID